ncbi:tyrosine-type recombinase/integrase [Streptococcus mutans]|uniref:tyrosine-type recombinase/integrase n=1 Tax=Streptococcus mutans TaxID=1309 RepID=UPI00034B4440|nr:tyrosine-type recombinase/integrase [Streptococcus mutans]
MKELDIAPKNMSSTGLRHSYCSLLLAKGVDIWAVAKLMGHKDIQMLIKVYGHTMTERIDKEFKEVESIMDRL